MVIPVFASNKLLISLYLLYHRLTIVKVQLRRGTNGNECRDVLEIYDAKLNISYEICDFLSDFNLILSNHVQLEIKNT